MTTQRAVELREPGRHAVAGSATLSGLIALVRIRACLAGGGSVLVGAYLSRGFAGLADGHCIAESIGIVAAVGAANAVNDLVDLWADTTARRPRPLADGRLSARAGRTAVVVLLAAALLLAFSAGRAAGFAMLVLLAVAIGYSYAFKGTIVLGNAVVACCASAPVVYGAMVAGPLTSSTWIASGLSLLFIFSYETLKTLRDRAGDAAAGLRTLATVADPSVSLRLFGGCAILLGATVIAAVAVSSTKVWYLLSAVPLLGYLTAAVVLAVRRGDIERSLRLLRIAWLIGLADMFLLR